jgi:nitrate reductase NapE component
VTKPTDVKSYANIPVAQPAPGQTVVKAPTSPSTAAAPTVGTQPQATTSTAPTNTKLPPLGKKRSPLITIIFIVLGIILLVAYAIVWALVFGLNLPFALPF